MLSLINSLQRIASLTLLMWADAHTHFGRFVIFEQPLYVIVTQYVKIDASNSRMFGKSGSAPWIYLMIYFSNSLFSNFVFVYLDYCFDICLT